MFASILAQVPAEPLWYETLVVTVGTLLGIPIVSSFLTGALRRLTDETGINPRSLVWLVAVVISGIAYWQAPIALPELDTTNLPAYVSGWLLLATGFSELAKKLYDHLLREWPVFAPPTG